MRTWYILIIGVLLVAVGCKRQDTHPLTVTACLEEADAALASDSIHLGETLLRKAIQLSEASEDWHANYIAYQRLAEALSQSNPEEALRLMKKALSVYESHPDDEQNYVILLDYAGTYAAHVAFTKEGSYDEALDFTHRAYDIAKNNQVEGLMSQTLTSLANIAWAKENYRQALAYAHQAKAVATADLLPGTLQVLARSYLSLDMLDSAEAVYRQIEPGDNVHLAYIVHSNLAKIALRRLREVTGPALASVQSTGGQVPLGYAKQVEDDVENAFEQVEDFYYKALEQKDEYYQETLRQEMENQRLEYRSRLYGRTLLVIVIAATIVFFVLVRAIGYRIRMLRQQRVYEQSRLENELLLQEQEKRRLQQQAEHQATLLHQANEVVTFLQDFILERTEVMKKLNQGGNALITLSPHEWNEIERTLNAIDSNRFARIREQYPSMQEDDIHLCILTRLGLSNRTIGNIYCITISAVQHRKLKLKKEVFGEANPDITLEQLLKS